MFWILLIFAVFASVKSDCVDPCNQCAEELCHRNPRDMCKNRCRPEFPNCRRPCGEHAQCVFNDTCACLNGYQGDGMTCTPVCDEPECGQNAICVSPNRCECQPGLTDYDGICKYFQLTEETPIKEGQLLTIIPSLNVEFSVQFDFFLYSKQDGEVVTLTEQIVDRYFPVFVVENSLLRVKYDYPPTYLAEIPFNTDTWYTIKVSFRTGSDLYALVEFDGQALLPEVMLAKPASDTYQDIYVYAAVNVFGAPPVADGKIKNLMIQ